MAITPTLKDTIERFIKYHLDDLNVSIPARVITYTNEEQVAAVQPILKERYRDDGSTAEDKDEFGRVQVDMPVIEGVPVIFPSANNGIVSFPVREGDLVYLVFSQRSLDLWLNTEDDKFDPQTINPQDNRMHDYTDAVAIAGINSFARALGTHPENFQIRYNVETGAECSISMTPSGDCIFDFPGKIKWNCAGWELYNTGNVREQIEGEVVSRISGDHREQLIGNYERIQSGTTTDRRSGNVWHDFGANFTVTVEDDILRGSREGKITDRASGDILRASDGKIDDSAGSDHTVNASGKVGLKSGGLMDFQHGGVLELDSGAVPSAPSAANLPTEGDSDGLVIFPTTLRFVETRNSSFQYSSKFVVIDNPSEGGEDFQLRMFGLPNWITLSRRLRTGRDSTAQLGVSGLGQDIIVVDLNENTKDLPIGTYTEILTIEQAGDRPNGIRNTLIQEIKIILEIRA